ncbi:methyltransferase domain-containing protein [Nioella aestuarii]|uniref:methyltransferase domain-containing protein n=1 Tax=Nioella aestuarii TaxID=1662864 RepID=UPI003D7F6F55
MLTFDAETAEILETAYQGADITRRRRRVFDDVAPVSGDRILDLGCGNGLLTQELARAVGPRGQVVGLDPSPEMRALAQERCAGLSNVDIRDGAAERLPFDEASFDKAVSLQVFEYLDDLPAVSAELFRVLRPGGRLVVGDAHWDMLAWFSDQPERMARMQEIWDCHLVDRIVPARLPSILTHAGYNVDSVRPITFTDTSLRPDGLANMMIILMTNYAIQTEPEAADMAKAWAEEQRTLARQGRFFFAITYFSITARKPDA